MTEKSLTDQFNKVVNDYHTAYIELAKSIKTVKDSPNYPDKFKDQFVLTANEGVTLGLLMAPEKDGRYLMMLGYVDNTLRQMATGMSVGRHHELLTLFKELNDKPDLIHRAFIVPDMDGEYYSRLPLVSVETYIPSDLEISKDSVEHIMKSVKQLINMVKKQSVS